MYGYDSYGMVISYDSPPPVEKSLSLDEQVKEAELRVKKLREQKAAEEEKQAAKAAEARRQELLKTRMSREIAIYYLGRAVDAKEEFVYKAPSGGPSCVYVEDGAPSCLIGWMLHLAGIPLSEMSGATHDSVRGFTSSGNTVPISRHEVLQKYIGPDALNLLEKAQRHQDRQVPWGQAVRQAIEETA
jgi:hypothetical protein